MTTESKPYTKALRDVNRLDNKVLELRRDPDANPGHVAEVIDSRDRARKRLATMRRLASQIFEQAYGY